MKKILAAIALIFVNTALAGVTIAEQTPVKIGWIGPLSGSASVLGVDAVPAMQMVFEGKNASGGIGGRSIQLAIEDDQYITQKTVAAYNRLVHHDKIRVLVVLTYGGLFALAPLAERDGVLLLNPLDCDERIAKLPKNTLCIAKLSEDLGVVNAADLVASDQFPAGIVYYDGDPFMSVVAEASTKTLQKHGRGWAYEGTYNETSTDFRAHVAKAKSLGVKSLFLYGYDQIGTAMKEARAQGLQARFYSLGSLTSPGFQELAGNALNGTYFSSWAAPKNSKFDDFLEKFKKRIGRAPHLEISTIPSYDIAHLLVAGLQSGALTKGGEVDVPVLRDYFYGIKNYEGLSGSITIDPDGITRSLKVSLYVWSKGEPHFVQ